MMGRLAMTDKSAIDEMFEGFFKVIYPLMKDPALHAVFYRSMVILGNRSENLHSQCIEFLDTVLSMDDDQPKRLAAILLDEFRERIG
ncbi:MAG: hypothetical protein AB2L20_26170 [Mangrovibacterium sp.]